MRWKAIDEIFNLLDGIFNKIQSNLTGISGIFTASHELCSVLGEFWDAEKIPYEKLQKVHEVPAAHPLAGGEVLLAVEPDPPLLSRGEGKKKEPQPRSQTRTKWTRL